MRRNALFQLGTGLGAPSSSRTKDSQVDAKALATDQQDDRFIVRNGVKCAGTHLIVDLYGAQKLDDIDHIEAALRACVMVPC